MELAGEEEDDWKWEAEPAMWHPVEDEDPLDVTTLPLLFHGDEVQQEPDLLNPPIEPNTDYPQYYITDETLPQPVIQISEEPHIAVLTSEDLWGKADLVTVWVNGEELTVNKAIVDEGLIKSDNFWDPLKEENLRDTLEMELLNETSEKTRLDKGKRKADTDLNERFPKKSDPLKRWRNRARARVVEKKPVGEKIPYQGQPEPYFDTETKKEYPGFEIFVEDT
ncbi:hypothetical protein RHSIM_Rhsim03G0117400 [Rhododendron simsii]|uniref:Uncharacterized protein n=1 Tax=Rhododendron simsii TaxID=118357 RepID=A0A834H6S5_RHOSS|nr:hypothetical protein RHSIM_Rhsim03G0117400 [Rhododendron simsii]